MDQYNWAILEIEDDVHVLTGCLKLFFRELKEPLIPCPLFERALQVTNYQGPNSERIRRYRGIFNSSCPRIPLVLSPEILTNLLFPFSNRNC